MLTQNEHGEYCIRYSHQLVPLAWAAEHRSHWLHTVAACMRERQSDVAIINTELCVAGPEYQLESLSYAESLKAMDEALIR